VPAEVVDSESAVSVTVTLYAADDWVEDVFPPCVVGFDVVTTLMLFTTGGEFCGR
jgi:hypothetical protein